MDVKQADLVIRVEGDPQDFVDTLLAGAAAVLPVFASRTPEERKALLAEMQADLAEATRPYLENGVLVFDSATNVLVARA